MVSEKDSSEIPAKGRKAPRRWVVDPDLPTLQLASNDPGIEIWVSPFGVGLLSIGLSTAPSHGLSSSVVLALNYALGQRARGKAHGFRRLSRAEEAVPPIYPEASGPVEERLNAPEGVFTIDELARHLIRAILDDPLFQCEIVQEQFSVFSVIRFPNGVNVSSPSTRNDLASMVTGLAQVEDAAHAGFQEDLVPVSSGLVTKHHWAAVGHLGATQIVTDQGAAFDEARVRRARDKYFVVYLVALLERLTMECFRERMAATVRTHQVTPATASDSGGYFGDVNEALSRLRRDVLEFTAIAHVTTVAARDSLHRYFRIASEGLLVAEAAAAVNSAIGNLDAASAAEQHFASANRGAETAERTLEVQHQILSLQQKVEWIEIFVIGYYALALGYYIGSALHFAEYYHGFGSLLLAFVSTGFAFVRLRPDRHRPTDEVRERRGWITMLIIIAVLLMLYVIVGVATKRSNRVHAAPAQANVPAAVSSH
jgi:hypothetical protein